MTDGRLMTPRAIYGILGIDFANEFGGSASGIKKAGEFPRSVKTNATPESSSKVTKGAQTALAWMGVWGKDGNESFPRRP